MFQVIELYIERMNLAWILGEGIPAIALNPDKNTLFGLDMSIESLRSQQYSYFIFGFLILSLIIFSFIIYLYMPSKSGKLKRGEKIMFGAIIFGVLSAVFIGWLQLVDGYLL